MSGSGEGSRLLWLEVRGDVFTWNVVLFYGVTNDVRTASFTASGGTTSAFGRETLGGGHQQAVSAFSSGAVRLFYSSVASSMQGGSIDQEVLFNRTSLLPVWCRCTRGATCRQKAALQPSLNPNKIAAMSGSGDVAVCSGWRFAAMCLPSVVLFYDVTNAGVFRFEVLEQEWTPWFCGRQKAVVNFVCDRDQERILTEIEQH
ncbi:hypothetical protein Bbelb_271140 [Branchiostoma belcheri]|nr:hypothetical protein Bbelb_271140 [Branchiostoma belcheri]